MGEIVLLRCLSEGLDPGGMVSELLEAVEEVDGWVVVAVVVEGSPKGSSSNIPPQPGAPCGGSPELMDHSLNFHRSVSNRDVCCRSGGWGRESESESESEKEKERDGERVYAKDTNRDS